MADDKKPLLDLNDEKSFNDNDKQVHNGDGPQSGLHGSQSGLHGSPSGQSGSRHHYRAMDESPSASNQSDSTTSGNSGQLSDEAALKKPVPPGALPGLSPKELATPDVYTNRQSHSSENLTESESNSAQSLGFQSGSQPADGDYTDQGIPSLIVTTGGKAASVEPSSRRHPHNIKSHFKRPKSRTINTTEQDTDSLQESGGPPQSDADPTMEHNGHFKNKKPATPPDPNEKTPFFVYYLACFATIGGLLFGYDTGIVSGSMLLIKDYYHLNTIWQELIVSVTVGSACIFSLFAGFLCDSIGRKKTIMIASIVFVIGAVVMGAAQSKEMLMVGRIIVGIGIGFASMTVPVYIAEAAPPAIRGRLVTMNQLFITIGILISSIIAGAFSTMKEDGWRYMLALAGVPGIIQFVGFIFLPESPRWLVMKGRDVEAESVLQQIRGKADVHEEINEIKEVLEEDKKNVGIALGRVFKTPHVRKALFVGCGLQVFQQLCGINTVIYYSATILKMAGFPPQQAIWLVLVPNSINFLSTIAGVLLVERLGRKKLLVVSFVGVWIALVVLAVGFQLSANFSPAMHNITDTFDPHNLKDACLSKQYSNCESCIEDTDCGFCYQGDGANGTCLHTSSDDEDIYSQYGRCNETYKSDFGMTYSHGFCPTSYTWMAVLGLALFVLAFAPGLGPMPWTINSEIYPMWARSTGNALATGCNWIFNLIVSLVFLTLTEAITKYGTFWLFAGICIFGLIFTVIFVPETKNKTLEEVEDLFRGKKKGSDNLGYEREIQYPKDGATKDITRL